MQHPLFLSSMAIWSASHISRDGATGTRTFCAPLSSFRRDARGPHIAVCAEDMEQEAIAPQIPPKICFQLLKEKDARKKLQDLGLSGVGDKIVRMPSLVLHQHLHFFLLHSSRLDGISAQFWISCYLGVL
jgi:hypothetical protein